MIETPAVTLTGSYVKLEPLKQEHYATLKSLSQDESISTYSPALKLKFDSWFNKALKNDITARQQTFIVRSLSDNQIIGSTRFYEMYLDHKRLSIGYTWYIPAVWGTAVNVECKLLLLQYAFEKLEMNRIEFFIDARNTRSRAAVKKLGATEEGILRQHIILEDGYIRDTVIYSILKNEWPLISANLQKKLRKE
jgi:RimJ/RimL family protein N-acetyltransferase